MKKKEQNRFVTIVTFLLLCCLCVCLVSIIKSHQKESEQGIEILKH